MTLQSTRTQRRLLKKQNGKLPKRFLSVDREHWPEGAPPGLMAVYRSAEFLVQQFQEKSGLRLSICRTQLNGETGRWYDEITWDDLQGIKRGVGLSDYLAIEIFPRDINIVNVANMRHLWIIENDSLPAGMGWFRE